MIIGYVIYNKKINSFAKNKNYGMDMVGVSGGHVWNCIGIAKKHLTKIKKESKNFYEMALSMEKKESTNVRMINIFNKQGDDLSGYKIVSVTNDA